MNCDRMRVSCAIDRLTDTLSGPDWPTFFTTLLATLVGAGISALVTWAIFRSERKDRDRSAMQVAVTRVIDEIAQLIAQLQAFHVGMESWQRNWFHARVGAERPLSKPDKPSVLPLIAANQALAVIATAEDRPLVGEMTRIVASLQKDEPTATKLGTLSLLLTSIVSWSSRTSDREAVLEGLRLLPLTDPNPDEAPEPEE